MNGMKEYQLLLSVNIGLRFLSEIQTRSEIRSGFALKSGYPEGPDPDPDNKMLDQSEPDPDNKMLDQSKPDPDSDILIF